MKDFSRSGSQVRCTCDNISETAQDKSRYYYRPLIGSDIMAYTIVTIQMTLSDLQGHVPVVKLSKLDFSYSSAVFDKIARYGL